MEGDQWQLDAHFHLNTNIYCPVKKRMCAHTASLELETQKQKYKVNSTMPSNGRTSLALSWHLPLSTR